MSTDIQSSKFHDIIDDIENGLAEEVSMVGWGLGDSEACKLSTAIKSRTCKLKTLRIGFNNIGGVRSA